MNTIEMEEKRKMQIDSRMKGLIDEAVKGKKKSVYYGDIMIAFTGTELTQDEFTYIVDMLEKKSIELPQIPLLFRSYPKKNLTNWKMTL